MKNTILALFIFLLLLASCDNEGNTDTDSTDDGNTLTIAYSAGGPDVSRFLGWQWAKEGTDFLWLFKNDGTVTVIHCCGEVYPRQFSYLLRGNVLLTYGSEGRPDEIEATNFTMADTNVSFTRVNGDDTLNFTKKDPDDDASPDSPLVLANNLLGTWRGEDGTEWEFSSDTGLKITKSSGDSGQYGYLVWYKELLTLGPLVDGTDAALREYLFNREENMLYLRRSDGKKYTLSLVK